jgi:nucleotide-binding universal stress UspA family protein
MRILLAHDGSASSDAACRLVGSLDWPGGSVITVIAVVEPVFDLAAAAVIPGWSDDVDLAERAEFDRVLDLAAAILQKPGRIVQRSVFEGRPASVIVDAAVEGRAELIVVGSRGLGTLKSMVLGSVSAEVVDHAPCPVLVVRRPSVGSVLLAVDGSPSAHGAVRFLGACGFLADRPVEVLAVAPSTSMLPPISLAGITDDSFEAGVTSALADREATEVFAANAVESLRADGIRARWSVSRGGAAREILDAAETFGSDLIVLGSRGRTGLTRLLLGSVARNVLLHAAASVLIVREPARARARERVTAREATVAVPPVPAGSVG